MTKRKSYLLFTLLSSLLFLILRHGFTIFDPTNLSWLRGDSQFHHIAFAFFRQDNWHWPPGIIQNLSYPIGTSIGATDSIPLLAFIFKGVSSLIPFEFQYFGWWQVICILLQGYWSFKIFEERLDSPLKSFLGSLFFITTPLLLSWRFIHGGLSAHFLILWSFSYYFPIKEGRIDLPLKNITFILFLSSLIQPYFLPMIYGIFFVFIWLKRNQINKIKLLFSITFPIMISIFGLYLAGHFKATSAQDPWGFGYYNTDLLSFINPMETSLFIPGFPMRDGQHEGFAYLGLGIIVLILYYLKLFSKDQIKNGIRENKEISILLIAFFIYSFGSTFSILGWKFLSISKLYWIIGPIKNIFRSSGRFIWPVYYSLIFSILLVALKKFEHPKWKQLFYISLFIQLLDLSPLFYKGEKLIPFAMVARFKDSFKVEEFPNPFPNSETISLFPRRYGDIDCLKGAPLSEQQERNFFWFALKNNLKSTALMGAGRSPKNLINKECQKEWELLLSNGPKEATIYTFSGEIPSSEIFKKEAICSQFNSLSWCTRSTVQ